MFDTLSSLYEALTPVLGLGDVDELVASLAAARLAYDNQRKDVGRARDALVARLDLEDEHAALVAAALGARKPDLDAIEQLLEDAPDYSGDTAILRRLAGLHVPCDERDPRGVHGRCAWPSARSRTPRRPTPSARPTSPRCCAARSRSATPEPTDDCPVCGTPDVLDDAWANRATEEAAALDEQARALTRANAELAPPAAPSTR